MNRNQKIVYSFIYDDNKYFYRGIQMPNGDWSITSNSQMYPLVHNPRNLTESPIEFATNRNYNSMNRSITNPFEFIFDGAAILNSKYLLGKGTQETLYYALFEFDDTDGKYKLSYNGRIDFQQKKRDDKLATFTVPIVDDSAWGILSQNDEVEFGIDCSENNPKAIKVLFDNFTLKNKFTFQTVNSPILGNGYPLFVSAWSYLPFLLVNQDGDSSGLVVKSQSSGYLTPSNPYGDTVDPSNNNDFFRTAYPINNVIIEGSLDITSQGAGQMEVYFATSKMANFGQWIKLYPPNPPGLQGVAISNGGRYKQDFSITRNLVSGERLFLILFFVSSGTASTITPIVTNCFVTTLTKIEPTICYGLRPLDLLKDIVKKATIERYTIGSSFFEVNNKTILIPGDSFRGVKDAKIYTSFKDFFQSFNALFYMALRIENGSLFMELMIEVYKQDTNIIDLGELIECETYPANEYIVNELEAGSPKQDYRHPSGRLEFNDFMTFSFPFLNVKNKLSIVSKYRTDGYGMIFLILDYRGSSTKDNSGDKQVFIADITDEQGSANEDVETFENININNSPLAPIIKYPLTGDIINYNKPLLKGVGIPGTNVNIYFFAALDGGTVVDGAGNWSYQMTTALPSYNPGVFDGIAVINATNTDMSGVLDTIQLIIDTTAVAPTGITYPRSSDALYNNLPLIKGVAPNGTNINIFLDGVFLAAVTADNSCKWEYKITVPLTNANHTLDIGTVPISFSVNSSVAFPLITFVNSELDGFIITNNLPLVKGVAIPGTIVTIWLNYVSYAALGTALADANGDWSFQVVPITYLDPISGLPIVLAPIRNGLNVFSTSLVNEVVQIAVTGYKLNRPPYSSITGVLDNTVINTRLSPKRMILNHGPLLSGIMNKQRNDFIHYQTADKNPELRTVLGTEVVIERADIPYSSLGNPLMLMEQAKIKTIAKRRFADILYDFNNGGTVKGTFKGKELFFLPIGDMKMKSIMDDVQDWNLLISPLTSYATLLNLYKNGLTLNLMENSIFHSDYNTLHMVTYNFTQPDKYNFKTIYDDWFDNRNGAWLNGKTNYIQKLQITETGFRDQLITNGISSATLRMYRCKDATLVTVFNYNPVAPAPIPGPEIVLEAIVDLQTWAVDREQYFFVIVVSGASDLLVAISERIETRTKWDRTILIESSNSVNQPGVFYSTGFKTIVRVEGLVKKIQPNIDTVIAKEESGNTKLLYSQLAKKRMIRFGTAKGFPDYLGVKCACALTNDNCLIEGIAYTLQDGEKINPSDDIEGVPMYHYDVNMTFQDNSKGKVFPGQDGADVGGVIIVVDASAIGIPGDSLIDISEV